MHPDVYKRPLLWCLAALILWLVCFHRPAPAKRDIFHAITSQTVTLTGRVVGFPVHKILFPCHLHILCCLESEFHCFFVFGHKHTALTGHKICCPLYAVTTCFLPLTSSHNPPSRLLISSRFMSVQVSFLT